MSVFVIDIRDANGSVCENSFVCKVIVILYGNCKGEFRVNSHIIKLSQRDCSIKVIKFGSLLTPYCKDFHRFCVEVPQIKWPIITQRWEIHLFLQVQ